MSDDRLQLTWRKSSHSKDADHACLEMATAPGARIHVRDSKGATDGPHLVFAAASWSLFIALTTAD
jgi:hypothetical protein